MLYQLNAEWFPRYHNQAHSNRVCLLVVVGSCHKPPAGLLPLLGGIAGNFSPDTAAMVSGLFYVCKVSLLCTLSLISLYVSSQLDALTWNVYELIGPRLARYIHPYLALITSLVGARCSL